MVFWGVQVKAGKPYIHVFDKALGRLHISQATLGIESSIEIGQLKRKSIVQCNVGAKTPVLLCSLLPDKTESCPLNLEFEEEDEVVFSVIGSKSVHLTGYYILGTARDSCVNDNYDTHHSDSYGEDIAETETEKSSDYDSEDEDEYDSDFIDDGDLEVFPPSPVSNTRVVIDEILEDEKPTNVNVHRRRLKKKYQVSDSDSRNSGSMDVHLPESEDEDNVPISSIFRSKYCLKKICTKVEEDADKEVAKEQEKKKAKGDDNQFKCLKRKANTVHDDYASKSGNGTGQPYDSSVPSIEIGPGNSVKPKKKKKKVYDKEVKNLEGGNDCSNDVVNEDKFQIEVEKVENLDQDMLDRHEAHEEVDSSIPSVLSIDVGLERGVKPKKKKKVYAKGVKTLEVGNDSSMEIVNVDKFQIEVEKIENVDQDMLVRHEAHAEVDSSIPSVLSIDVGLEGGVKPKKKKVYAKEAKTLEMGNDSSMEVVDEGKFQIEVEKIENVDQDMLVRQEGHEETDSAIPSLPSIDVGHEDGVKPKKKKKVYAKEVKTLERGNDSSNEVVNEDKFQIEVEKIENMDQFMLVRHEAHEEVDSSIPSMISIDVGHEDGLKPKKKKKNKGKAKKNDVGDEAELLPPNSDNKGFAVEIEYVAAENYSDEKKKKMKNKNKIQGSIEMNANTEETILEEKRGPSSIETENNKKAEGDPLPAMTLSNELMIMNEEFEVGIADGEEAATMKKATKTRPPVPTSMGHGSHGAGEKVLRNSLF